MADQDAHLWKLFVSGDKAAFKTLMERYFRFLFTYAMKFSKNEELIKDTLQELFILLWNRKENLNSDVNPKAYLISSLRRALHRKLQFESRFVPYSELEDDINYFDFEISIEERMIKNEGTLNQAREIAKGIMELPQRQKEVVYLKFFKEMSREEIAEAMNISPQTVSNMLQLALKRLRIEFASSLYC